MEEWPVDTLAIVIARGGVETCCAKSEEKERTAEEKIGGGRERTRKRTRWRKRRERGRVRWRKMGDARRQLKEAG